MALLLITNPPTTLATSADWTTFVTRSNANMLGHGLSIPIFTLTNWDASTTIPAIAEDSIIEVGGSFYQADADTALTPEGGIIDGTVHIKLVPAGGGASVVPTLTNDVIPAWDANKAGWYDTDDKFLPYEMTKASAVYTVKSEYIDQNKTIKYSTIGFYDVTVNNDLDVVNDLDVGGEISPTESPSASSVTYTSNTTYYFPVGIYDVSLYTSNSSAGATVRATLQKYINGSWEDIFSSAAIAAIDVESSWATLFSSGSGDGDMRVSITSTGSPISQSVTINWNKF